MLEPEQPWQTPHLLGAVEAFYVLGDVHNESLVAQLDEILGVESSSDYLWGTNGIETLIAAAAAPAGTSSASAWAWLG